MLSLSTTGFAQVVDISDCRSIEDRLERFDCYEGLDAAEAAQSTVTRENATAARLPVSAAQNLPVIRRPVNNAVVKNSTPSDSAEQIQPQATENSEVADFGKKSTSGNARLGTGEDGSTEMFDTIVALEQRRQNLWLITLESGQQWLQQNSKRYTMAKGDEVRIYPSIWGKSYRLTVERLGSYIQVERVD